MSAGLPWRSLLEQPHIVTLVVLLVLAAVIDGRTLRIPNWLSGGGALAGLLLHTLLPSPELGPGLALAGLVLGLLLMLPLYAMGVMGAGDVKLMAMVGAFVGLPHVVPVLLFVCAAGGLAALVAVTRRRAWPLMLAKLQALWCMTQLPGPLRTRDPAAGTPSLGRMPYGVSICAGTLAYLVWQGPRLH